MSSTIDYGLKFEIKELEKIKLQAKAIDKYFDSIANSTKFKSLSKTIQEMNTLFKNQEAILGMVNNKRDLEIKKQRELIALQQQRKKLEQDILDTAGRIPKGGSSGKPRSGGGTGSGASKRGSDDGKFDMFAPAKVAKRVAGYIGMSTAVYGTLAALRSGRDAIINYDQALHNTYMAIGNVTEAEKTMIKSITTNIEFTAKYGKSFVELAESMEVLVKAGFKVNEATILLEPSLRLAAAGDMNLDEAAKALSQSLRNIGKPMAYAAEMADALASGAAASAVDVKDLITSFEGVGAVGTNFGMQAKEIVAWLGALGNVGLKGRESANAISRLWLRLTKPQKEVMDILKGKGIELFEGNGTEKRIRKFEEIIKDLANASLSLQEKQKLLGIHAGKTAEQIFSAIPSYRALAIEMESISNSAEAMSKAKMEGLQSKIDTMKAAWDDIFISQNGISNAMGASIDKLKSLFILLAENPELTRLLAIGASAGAASLATGMVTKNPYAIGVAAIGAAGVSTYFLKDMQASNYNSTESIAERKKQEELAKKRMEAESDYVNKIANTKLYSLRKLKEEQSALNKELQKYVVVEDEINKKLKTTETQLKQGIIKPSDYYSRTGQLQSQRKMNTGEMIASMESFKLRSIQQEITKRQGNAETDAEREARLKKDDDLSKAHTKHMIELSKAEIAEREKMLEDFNKSVDKFTKEWEEESLKNTEEYNKELAKYYEDKYKRQEEVRKKYQGVDGKLADLGNEYNQEIELAQGNEELILEIKKSYADQAVDMYRDEWEKKNKIANAALDSMEAGYDSFSTAMSNDLQISKDESEMIWEAMKQSFIKKLMEMAWAAALSGIFSFFMNPLGSMMGGLGKGTGMMAGGVNLADFIVVDGKVHSFRKDDLVFGGTGLASNYGSQLPMQSQVNGGSAMAYNNNALIAELRSLKLAVIQSDSNNQKAIKANVPKFPDIKIGNKDIYKASVIGKKESSFIVSPK